MKEEVKVAHQFRIKRKINFQKVILIIARKEINQQWPKQQASNQT
jgi:hypothetical protein